MAYVVTKAGTLRTLECSCGPRLSLYPERAAAEWRSDFGPRFFRRFFAT